MSNKKFHLGCLLVSISSIVISIINFLSANYETIFYSYILAFIGIVGVIDSLYKLFLFDYDVFNEEDKIQKK